MNKQELIKKYEDTNCTLISINGVLEDLRQLDEPKEKVTLPRPVANWISCVRGRNKTLHFALENAPEEVNLWFCEDEKNRQNIFADAWVNGYHIEKEKRYIVKVKGVQEGYNCLNCRLSLNEWFFSGESEPLDFRVKHTRKMLKMAGFGGVFNNPLFEVEEVAE
ncbi:DUF1642 domain-containing protein [Streptococcus parasanguinis]|uniref:DUF1642 domain-containing protein n=1 Tax=Streptococcus parasanguinis TaxID=1318 RepID=UPI00319DDF7F